MSKFTDFWIGTERALFEQELEGIRLAESNEEREYHLKRGWEIRGRLEEIDSEFRLMLHRKAMQARSRRKQFKQEYQREFDKGLRIGREAKMRADAVNLQATTARADAQRKIEKSTFDIDVASKRNRLVAKDNP